MKKVNAKSLMIMSLAVVMAACASNKSATFTIPTNANTTNYGLAGRIARKAYRGLTTVSIGSLNYLETQESTNAQHFANFVDGLLVHNEYGSLVKNLATKVEHNDNYDSFKFTVRKGVKWQNYDGSQYKATIDGKKVAQYVVPSDWVTTAKAICSYSNASSLEYLVATFVRGAEEYYQYTRVQYEVATGKLKFTMDNFAAVAKQINKYIKDEKPAIWSQQYEDGDRPITADDVPNIANMSRFGVVADDDAMTVTYNLISKAPYFPTLFTYSCYLPTNQYFLKEVKYASFGTTKDKILYTGPYLLKDWSETNIEYQANTGYWNAANTVTVDKVQYTVITDTGIITDDYTRTKFEADEIDGFSLNMKDGIGWTKYVAGEDGTGTYDNPYSPYVNSRLTDTIGNMYGSNIVMDREGTNTMNTHSTQGSKETIRNASRALKLSDVRKAILHSYDLNQFFDLRYESTAEELRQQEKVYTYVPKGFVTGDDGKDYVTGHYYKIYSEKTGMPIGDPEDPQPGTVAYQLQPGQTETGTLSQEEVDVLVKNAVDSIKAYNLASDANITFPVQLEYYSTYFDADTKTMDDQVIERMNERLNHIAPAGTRYFNVVPTDKLTSSDYETVSRNGEWDISVLQWGWGADYGDPLTFMNTYVKGGDWGDVFPFIAKKDGIVENITSVYDAQGRVIGVNQPVDLLAAYTEQVKKGAGETDDFNKRYDELAKAEYMLINELNIYQPQNNNGQGWSLSVSRSAGYFMPTASYGLSSDRLTGWYILDQIMTREDRQAAREKQEELKAAYMAEFGAINIY